MQGKRRNSSEVSRVERSGSIGPLQLGLERSSVMGCKRPGLTSQRAWTRQSVWIAVSVIAFASVASGQEPSTTFRPEVWITEGPPYALAIDGGKLYLGGVSHVGPHSGTFAILDPGDASIDESFPKFDGEVICAIPDGMGGWYVGGDFRHVGGVERRSLAWILADGSVADWTAGEGGKVHALALVGSTLYVGGHFGGAGGLERENLAAIDALTGVALPWDPQIDWGSDDVVWSIVVSESTVFVGGFFDDSIGGEPRRHLAALDVDTALALPWNPDPDGAVTQMLFSGPLLYVAGNFQTIGRKPRGRLTALDIESGIPTAWNPDANSTVRAIALSGSTLYVGGLFTEIGGEERSRLAAVDAQSGVILPWDPSVTGSDGTTTSVRSLSLSLSGSEVYVGGSFTFVGETPREHLAEIDAATGLPTQWDPMAIGQSATFANVIRATESSVMVGGNFMILGGEPRNGLAAIDLSTGAATPWNPEVVGDGQVAEILIRGAMIYVGGNFDTVDGFERRCVAAFDKATGQLVSQFNVDSLVGPTCQVFALAATDSVLYLGGNFVVDENQRSIAAVDALTGELLQDWTSTTSNKVFDLALSEDETVLYLGGLFGDVGQDRTQRLHIASLDAATGAVTDWDPSANDEVLALSLVGSTVYAAGRFLIIGGQVRRQIAAIDATTGMVTDWDPSIDAAGSTYVSALAGSDDFVFAGGRFSTVGGIWSPHLAQIDSQSGLLGDWMPQASTEVGELLLGPSNLIVGGQFQRLAGGQHPHLAVFALLVDCPWDLNGDDHVGVADLLEVVHNFGPCEGDCPADFDDDGQVGPSDLLALIANFGVCPGGECPWDINGDGVVNQDDVHEVRAHFGECEDPDDCPWDIDGDGQVDGLDVQAVATHFGECR